MKQLFVYAALFMVQYWLSSCGVRFRMHMIYNSQNVPILYIAAAPNPNAFNFISIERQRDKQTRKRDERKNYIIK